MVAAPAPPAETMCASVSFPCCCWWWWWHYRLRCLLSLFSLLLVASFPLSRLCCLFLKSAFLFLRSRKTCFKYPYVVKYTPQFGNNAATVGPSPRYKPLTPSLRAIFFKLSIVLIYVESLSVDTCNLVFKTSKGQTITAAIAPDVAPDTQFTTPVSDKGGIRTKGGGRRYIFSGVLALLRPLKSSSSRPRLPFFYAASVMKSLFFFETPPPCLSYTLSLSL